MGGAEKTCYSDVIPRHLAINSLSTRQPSNFVHIFYCERKLCSRNCVKQTCRFYKVIQLFQKNANANPFKWDLPVWSQQSKASPTLLPLHDRESASWLNPVIFVSRYFYVLCSILNSKAEINSKNYNMQHSTLITAGYSRWCKLHPNFYISKPGW